MAVDSKTSLSLQAFEGSAYLTAHNASWLEALFEQYQKNPSQLSPEWQECFSKIASGADWSHIDLIRTCFERAGQRQASVKGVAPGLATTQRVQSLIDAYRTYGHLQANLDPLELAISKTIPALDPKAHGLSQAELEVPIALVPIALAPMVSGGTADLTSPIQLIQRLKAIYCGNIGFEYHYILEDKERNWLSEQIEASMPTLTRETKQRILHRLLESEGLEKHLGAQFVAQKRFSIEGGDSLMPMLDTIAIQARRLGVESLVLGMGHRGRLNVLVNFLGKPPSQLFEEFEGRYTEVSYSGDVKYHKGFESLLDTPYGELRASLAYNPSHLEFVNAVVEGIARAQQDQMSHQTQVLPILMHGDAAFSGQGIVMETLQLSQTQGFGTQGTIHIVSNNQLGFTTDPAKARSSRYCTDIAKMVEAPIFHVNGDDPEAACYVVQLALGFRMKFQKDVVIDLVCYRRYGHNEADEPAATQPLMYAAIKKHPPVWSKYTERLTAEGVIQPEEAEARLSQYRERVAKGQPVAPLLSEKASLKQAALIKKQKNWRVQVETNVSESLLKSWADLLTQVPQDMSLQPQVAKLLAERQKMIQGHLPLNWGAAETLAYASLLAEGFRLRLSGQDCERGTFSHRHAVLHDYKTGIIHSPLQALVQSSGSLLTITDSILSEAAVMGFEYGYACAQPKTLVIWEAQYGDFVNGAQVIIDQFLSASEQKWGQCCGLTLFLPHGYEGSGPEHSSARLERFLELCAQDNMQICVPTTPAQQFHLLRRQLRRDYQKPLVVMTPKSLLRHKLATSNLSELATGAFQAVIPDTIGAQGVKRLILCNGKVYYDLLANLQLASSKVAIIRIEQLYPFPDLELKMALKPWNSISQVIWCQEEPHNQGAWVWIQSHLQACLSSQQTVRYAGRSEAASPAVGSPLRHEAEQKALVYEALGVQSS